MTDAAIEIESELEAIGIEPVSSLYVNVDFNDLLETHSEEEAFELLGKLKDLLGA